MALSDERRQLLKDWLLSQRAAKTDYHNHKENVVYLALGASLAAIPFWAVIDARFAIILGPFLVLGLIANHRLMLQQVTLQRIAREELRAIETTISKLLTGHELVDTDLQESSAELILAEGIGWRELLGVGNNRVRHKLQKKKMPAIVAHQLEVQLNQQAKDFARNPRASLWPNRGTGPFYVNAVVVALLVLLWTLELFC